MKEEIKQKLFKLSDQKYKEFHSGLCPGTNNIIGVRIPVLRNYAKELAKKYSLKELIECIDDEYYEEIMLQGMLIGLAKNNDINELKDYIKIFIPKINNWAVCDIFCSGLKITKKYKKEMWNFIDKYLNSKKEFEIRFGVVMLLDYYIDEVYIDEVLQKIDQIESDGYYVKMAVAWAVSICLIKFYDKTLKYLTSCKLDDFTYNKSLQKARESYRITDAQKEHLQRLKRL